MKKLIELLNTIRINTDRFTRVTEISKIITCFYVSDTFGDSGIVDYDGQKIYYSFDWSRKTYFAELAG